MRLSRSLHMLCLGLLAISGAALGYPAHNEYLSLEVEGGAPIRATLRVPDSQAKGATSSERLPALMVFGGFEEAGRVLELLNPSERVVLASFDYPYEGERVFRFPGTLKEAPKLKLAANRMLAAIPVLAKALAARADVEPRHVGVVGASFGAPFAIRAAVVSPDISGLILVHGFADVRGTMQSRLTQIWARKFGWLATPLAWFTATAIDLYLDPPKPEEEAAKLRPDQQVLMIEALNDTFIPKRSRELLWQSLQKSTAKTERIAMPGEHLMPGANDLIAEIMRLSQAWMKRIGW